MASALAFFIAPVIYFLNLYYCLTIIPKDDYDFYPRPLERWFAWGSLAVFTGISAVLIIENILNRPIFGG